MGNYPNTLSKRLTSLNSFEVLAITSSSAKPRPNGREGEEGAKERAEHDFRVALFAERSSAVRKVRSLSERNSDPQREHREECTVSATLPTASVVTTDSRCHRRVNTARSRRNSSNCAQLCWDKTGRRDPNHCCGASGGSSFSQTEWGRGRPK